MDNRFKHGYAHKRQHHPLYQIWATIKQRCLNPNNKDFKYYGSRGISISSEWQNSPKSFIEWSLKNGYENGLIIDRIDNNKNYCKENCRFVTPCISSSNKRRALKYKRKQNLPIGVALKKDSGKFEANINCNKKMIYLGKFKTPEEASKMYQKALKYINNYKILNHRNDLINFIE